MAEFINQRKFSFQSGNVILAAVLALAVAGAIGATATGIIKGPMSGMNNVSFRTVAENDMASLTALLSEAPMKKAAEFDCDLDGVVEPIPFKAAGSLPAPAGGGLLPDIIIATKTDPWKTSYGYCVWDHGSITKNTLCGGASVGRLAGGDTSTANVIAVISAGPDRIFQTTCAVWVNDATPLVNRPAGSDDIVKTLPYGQFTLPVSGDSKLKEMPDEACTPQSLGIMRLEMGVVQSCTESGWEEVGTFAQADTNFVNVTNAALGSLHTSNEITFTGFMNEKTLTLTGAATLLVNGVVASAPVKIKSGDKVSLRANAAGVPLTTNNFSIAVGGVVKGWSIQTRVHYPAALSITPVSASNMDVRGPVNPSYGARVSFLVRNTGELSTVALSNTVLSNTANFEFDPVPSGDGCRTKILAPNATCVIDVRPKATSVNDLQTITSSLSVAAGSISATATPLTGTANGWTCTSPWGGPRINSGSNVTAYQTATVAYNATCVSQTRTCTADVLSGTYTHQSCAPVAALNCSAPWGATVNHGNSVTAYAAANVPFGSTCSSQTRTCTNGVLSGTYTASGCTVTAPASCSLPWGGALAHGGSVTAYAASSVPHGSTCSSQTRSCSNGTLSGSYTASGCTVAAPVCGGALLWGVCFYKVMYTENVSCRQFCSSRGGLNLPGYLNNVARAGTLAKCHQAIAAVGFPNISWVSNCPGVNGGGANCSCVTEGCLPTYLPTWGPNTTGYRCTAAGAYNADVVTTALCACNN